MIKGGEQLNRLSRKGTRGALSPWREAALYLQDKLGAELPGLALILGSGFQRVLDSFRIEGDLDVTSIVGFPEPRVKGHSGRLVVANIEGVRVLVLSGRAHYYEGHSMETVMFPVRMLAECQVRQLVLTNAAGGINPAYQPGDFMLFSDHINFIAVNPLRGLPVEDGRCFVDLSDTYCAGLRASFRTAAQQENISLQEGVYLGVSGPSYETPAEIRAFRTLGADAVGMSTIPEALMARYCGMRVAALSCITNHAAGLSSVRLSHQEVLQAGQKNAANAARLLRRFAINVRNDAKT
jgi:purine-nucleoside phosphorylase